jgi:parallel beta-helix repeat protein
MSRWFVFILVLLALSPYLLHMRVNLAEVKASNGLHVHNLNTGLNYTAIQEAIDASETLDGHTIFAETWTYYENIVVNKALVVIGENSTNTIIDGNETGTVVSVTAENVTIRGFTIRGAPEGPDVAGILVENVLLGATNVQCTISGNVFSDNHIGVELYAGVNNNTICDNVFSNDTQAIELAHSDTNLIAHNMIFNNSGGLDVAGSHNLIYNNTFANNTLYDGISLSEGQANVVRSNLVVANGRYGILLGGEENIIVGNTISGNQYGIYWSGEGSKTGRFDHLMYHNDFINNTIQAYEGRSLMPPTSPPWPSPNRWDNGYLVGGNYWNDYVGNDICSGTSQNETGSDGIGDTPYNITVGLFVSYSQDRYPLMYPWSSLPVHNINTGLSYATVQEAIDSIETFDGHRIFVESGMYHENVVVNKTLSLVGEDREATIIDGNESGNAVTVLSNGTSLSSFTLQAPGWVSTYALDLENVTGTTTANNTLTNSFSSLMLRSSNFNTIVNNNIAPGNMHSTFGNSSHNTLTGNIIGGLYFTSSSNNTLIGNTIGFLWLWFSSNTGLRDNNLSYFEVDGNINLQYIHDIDSSNTLNGKPIYYWVNRENAEVPPDAGYMALIDCVNITVRGSDFENNFQSILMFSTNNSRILNNNVTSVLNGIWISASSNNIICGNSIANGNYGIQLLDECSNNDVHGNNIRANGVGIWLGRSSNNNIFNNNFINNGVQVDSYKSINAWDGGYPSGGNYWSNCSCADLKNSIHQNETGSDGIGDTPYIIDANNTDNYPLIGIFSDFNTTSEYHVQTICNSSISDFQLNATTIMFNSARAPREESGMTTISPALSERNGKNRKYRRVIQVHDCDKSVGEKGKMLV